MRRTLSFEPGRCLACRSCEIACVVAHSSGGSLAAALAEVPLPLRRVVVAAGPAGLEVRRCEQCAEPLCVFACKSGALWRDLRSGVVHLDESRCLGCSMCLMVCPFGLRLDAARHRVVRCDLCAGRVGGANQADCANRADNGNRANRADNGNRANRADNGNRADDADHSGEQVAASHPACVVACPTRALGLAEAGWRTGAGADTSAGTETGAPTDFAGRLVVVGSSAAGLAACEAAHELAPACAITLVTADQPAHYSRPLLAYALAGRLDRASLGWRPEAYLEGALGVRVLCGCRAVALRAGERVLVLDGGEQLGFDRLVLATGARATPLRVPGAGLPGVLTLRELGDLETIERLALPGRCAVVVGAGNVGLQACEALLCRGLRVTLVYRSPHVLSQMVDAEVGRRAGELFVSHGARLRPGRDPVEILGGEQVSAVRLDDGELLDAELVVVGKGITPNVDWLAQSGLELRRGVVVDGCGRTNIDGIFAAGDCAESVDPLTGESAVSGIWPVAYELGRAAGSSAVGARRPSAGALRMNVSTFFGASLLSIGEVRPERLAGARAMVEVCTPASYRKLVYRGEQLVGALLYGDISGAGSLYRCYREAATVERPAPAPSVPTPTPTSRSP